MAKPRKMKKPRWLSLLLRSTFFGLCQHHGELKKSEVNTYCLDCGKSMCLHCWSSLSSAPENPHDGHKFLQIRRYVYQDVIRVSDLQKYVDCSKVQSFIVNGAKVVLLNPKRQTKSATPASNGLSPCGICRRMIPEPNRYCSIACKAAAMEGENDSEPKPSISPENSELEDSPSSPLEGGASSAVVCYRPPPSSPSSLDQDRTRPAPPESSAGRRLSKRKGIPQRARFF